MELVSGERGPAGVAGPQDSRTYAVINGYLVAREYAGAPPPAISGIIGNPAPIDGKEKDDDGSYSHN